LTRFNFGINYRPEYLNKRADVLTRKSGDLQNEGGSEKVQLVLKKSNVSEDVAKNQLRSGDLAWVGGGGWIHFIMLLLRQVASAVHLTNTKRP